MLNIIKNNSQTISVETLYQRAKEYNMLVTIEEKSYTPYFNVTLTYDTKKGSNFRFKGVSNDDLIDAFVRAFDEAKILGITV